ncbi:pyridoxamine 5'-phosphate oxidase family protein [Prevotella communis]|uniref:pyridoxamine 5'-phosphate oxidase family protein n=1 Tax=Prevotella communis TaxID=2913614 RepID=UPI001EDA8165|nr:pyridoxamine 5'-phosphate oxidase family protein [Prevotella communis]UKK61464.1 pyridoxamine 5'-phosphate oxidase family protein [Prevotella communis]UKK61472.1 pyridoxamine 5'-phosphate oxidase family protein [Prevotella communis]UKK64290.1 pyridoxamine 5'-phosphate oxidase family protein [Prevotella communis]UKK64298.1 pyridoxamine 5'-phosphate oxidase family protein [Prevotella communis]
MFDKAIQFLKDHKEIALATCEGNLPKLRIFQIMKQEGHVLYFATSDQKAVYRELRQNPNVEILAYADNISVRCSGMVNFNVEDDVKQWIYNHNDVLSRLYNSYDQLEYFCLPIADLDYFDLSPTPPVNLHFDLMAGEIANGFVGERFCK